MLATCFTAFATGAFATAGALVAAGAGACARPSCACGVAEAIALLYSHAEPTAGASPNRASADIATTLFTVTSTLNWDAMTNLRVFRTLVNDAVARYADLTGPSSTTGPV